MELHALNENDPIGIVGYDGVLRDLFLFNDDELRFFYLFGKHSLDPVKLYVPGTLNEDHPANERAKHKIGFHTSRPFISDKAWKAGVRPPGFGGTMGEGYPGQHFTTTTASNHITAQIIDPDGNAGPKVKVMSNGSFILFKHEDSKFAAESINSYAVDQIDRIGFIDPEAYNRWRSGQVKKRGGVERPTGEEAFANARKILAQKKPTPMGGFAVYPDGQIDNPDGREPVKRADLEKNHNWAMDELDNRILHQEHVKNAEALQEIEARGRVMRRFSEWPRCPKCYLPSRLDEINDCGEEGEWAEFFCEKCHNGYERKM